MIRILSVVAILILIQCARTTQPNGGPKDLDPPQLVKSVPENGQKNFSGKNIELEFDEYLKLKDPKEEILITPTSGPETKFILKKNKLSIVPQYEWQQNTTYSIAFREGLQDLNESNPADDLHIAFSTGDTIDSLQISGSIDEAFAEKIPEKITIAAYQLDTFNIFNHKPTYFTKSNKKGKFSIQNLKPGSYYIYAFEDKNKNFKVDSKTEKFGFITKPYSIPEQNDSIRVSIFHCDSRKAKVTSVRNTNSISLIRFNKLLSSAKLESEKPLLYSFGDNNAELIVYKDFDPKDSIKIRIHTLDSTNQTLDTIVYVKYTDSKKIEDKLKIKPWKSEYEFETKTFTTQTETNKLITSVNFDSLYIQIDSATIQQINSEDYKFDTLFKKITITKKLKVTDDENKRPNPVFILGKGSFISLDQDSSKTEQINIKIPKSTEVGSMEIEIKTEEPHFIVNLISAANVKVKSYKDSKKITFQNILAGEYKILVHIDKNNDQKWNAGNFVNYHEAEKVFFYKFLGKKYSEPIRANWEIGPFLISF